MRRRRSSSLQNGFNLAIAGAAAYYNPNNLSSLYQDSSGTTAADAVGDPVGLMLDAKSGLVRGSEVSANGGFDSDTGWTKLNATISSGTINLDGSGGVTSYGLQDGQGVVAGDWYEYSFEITSVTAAGSGVRLRVGTAGITGVVSSVGTHTGIIRADGSDRIQVDGLADFVGSIDNVSVKPLSGNHATQSTSGSRPLLGRQPKVGGRNLLTYTEAFDNAAWTKFEATISADAATDPNGDANADKLVESSATQVHNTFRTNVSVTSGTTYTYSLYVKASDYSWIQLATVLAGFGSNDWANFDVTNGVVGNVGSGATASIEAAGNGYYRCSITVTAASTSAASGVQATLTDDTDAASRNPSYAGDGTSGIYIWGAQLEEGSSASTHQSVGAWYDVSEGTPTVDNHVYLDAFDQVDDYLTAAAGGGGTTGIMICCAVRVPDSGSAATIWSDRGTNTGYRLSINASNQIQLSAGNGTTYTTVTGDTLTAQERYVILAWHDGTNLNVQVDNGTVASTAFATATAGTDGFTIARDNGASSGYWGRGIFSLVYTKNDSSSALSRSSVKRYISQQAGITL